MLRCQDETAHPQNLEVSMMVQTPITYLWGIFFWQNLFTRCERCRVAGEAVTSQYCFNRASLCCPGHYSPPHAT